ncbi:MAG: MFS transporter [Candidatus Methanomethylophilaceae archaeon]|nr:MFS transporter [Candidatus Methanomethylophilaceae archaeon]
MAQAVTFKDIDPKVRKLSMIGLALGMMIACMDGTIVGTCAAEIARDLGGMELYSWLVTAYLLSETGMVPIAGKMSDRYGRKPLFILGLCLFIGGSVVAGLSSNMTMLIVCRAVQGLGGGILMPVAMAAVADFYAPEERGKMQGMLGAVFGIGSGIGPLVGGFICTYVSWHWVFYINVPLAVICFILTLRQFPSVNVDGLKRIDYLGMVVLTALILDILLFFQQLGEKLSVDDWKMILMMVLAFVLLAAFIFIEKKAEDPIIAPKLVHKRIVVLGAVYLFILGLAMIGVLTYVALYIITIYDYDTLQCGFALLPMVFGMMITSMGSGMLVHRTGYRIWVITGSIVMVVSLLLMSTMGSTADINVLYIYLFLFGMGLGFTNSTVMIAVQNATPSDEMGMTTSAVSVMRNIGSTVGTALFALVISSSMNTKFAETVYAYLADAYGLSGTGLIGLRYIPIPGMQPDLANTVTQIFGDSVCTAFLMAGLLYIVALVISFFIDKKTAVEE